MPKKSNKSLLDRARSQARPRLLQDRSVLRIKAASSFELSASLVGIRLHRRREYASTSSRCQPPLTRIPIFQERREQQAGFQLNRPSGCKQTDNGSESRSWIIVYSDLGPARSSRASVRTPKHSLSCRKPRPAQSFHYHQSSSIITMSLPLIFLATSRTHNLRGS